jgi:hypothetical protein
MKSMKGFLGCAGLIDAHRAQEACSARHIVHNSRFHFPRVSNKSALIFWITAAAVTADVTT